MPRQSGADEAGVEVSFGGHKKKSPEPFTYVDDPTITMIEPKKSILRSVARIFFHSAMIPVEVVEK